MHKMWGILGLGALVMLALAAGAHAQDAAAVPKIAWVDLDQVNSQYGRLKAKRDELKVWYQRQDALLKELGTNYLFLSQELFDEARVILEKPRPLGADDAKRQEELRQISDEKENRYLELEGKPDRTPREREEFLQLQEIAQGRSKQLEALAKGLQQQLMEMQSVAEAELTGNMQTVVQQLASERGFTIVLNKLGVLYGGEDITAAVLEKLNGAPPAAPAATPAEGGGN